MSENDNAKVINDYLDSQTEKFKKYLGSVQRNLINKRIKKVIYIGR